MTATIALVVTIVAALGSGFAYIVSLINKNRALDSLVAVLTAKSNNQSLVDQAESTDKEVENAVKNYNSIRDAFLAQPEPSSTKPDSKA